MAEPEGVWTGYLSTAPMAAYEAVPQIAEPPSWYQRVVATARLAG
jgi:hypothetical protein